MSAERLENVKRTASIIDDVTQKLESTVKPINSWNSEHRHQVSNKRYRYVGLGKVCNIDVCVLKYESNKLTNLWCSMNDHQKSYQP